MYQKPSMKSIWISEDILTISVAAANTEQGWGNLDFGGAVNTPLAELAGSIAEKL